MHAYERIIISKHFIAIRMEILVIIKYGIFLKGEFFLKMGFCDNACKIVRKKNYFIFKIYSEW